MNALGHELFDLAVVQRGYNFPLLGRRLRVLRDDFGRTIPACATLLHDELRCGRKRQPGKRDSTCSFPSPWRAQSLQKRGGLVDKGLLHEALQSLDLFLINGENCTENLTFCSFSSKRFELRIGLSYRHDNLLNLSALQTMHIIL